jgi:hypothetical protein
VESNFTVAETLDGVYSTLDFWIELSRKDAKAQRKKLRGQSLIILLRCTKLKTNKGANAMAAKKGSKKSRGARKGGGKAAKKGASKSKSRGGTKKSTKKAAKKSTKKGGKKAAKKGTKKAATKRTSKGGAGKRGTKKRSRKTAAVAPPAAESYAELEPISSEASSESMGGESEASSEEG